MIFRTASQRTEAERMSDQGVSVAVWQRSIRAQSVLRSVSHSDDTTRWHAVAAACWGQRQQQRRRDAADDSGTGVNFCCGHDCSVRCSRHGNKAAKFVQWHHALVPCGHARFCESCANRVAAEGGTCHVCRMYDHYSGDARLSVAERVSLTEYFILIYERFPVLLSSIATLLRCMCALKSLKAKFHYAIWFEPSSNQLRSR